MLIDFFYTLRSAKLPVSVKEYLTLLEALQANVVGPNSDDGYKIDDFYYLSRTALVKDEKHFDKFDRAFAAYFKGVEMIADFTKDVPLEWLRKNLELELSPEEKAKIEKMGWDELMETLKKRFEEQKERHEGGNKMDRHRRHLALRRLRLQPAGHPHRPGQGPQQERGQGLGPARLQGLRRHQELGTRNIKVALRRLRKFAREGHGRRAGPGRHHPQHRGQCRLAGHQDGARAPQQREGAAADGRGRHHGRAHPPRGRAVLGRQDRVQAPGVLLLPQLRLRLHVEEQPAPLQREVRHLGHHPQVQQGLQAHLRRRRHDEPVRDPAARRQRGIQQRGSRRRMAAAPDPRLPQVRLDQPRAAGRVAVPPEHQRHPAAGQPAHVPADPQGGPGRGPRDAPCRRRLGPPGRPGALPWRCGRRRRH
jgi:hypothetical protein